MKTYSYLFFFAFLIACKKSPDRPLTREEQIEQERKETLLPNQILEKDALRISLAYVAGDSISVESIEPDPRRSNNFILYNSQIADSSSVTLKIKYHRVKNGGAFDMTIEGFTNLNTTKKFTLPGNTYSLSDEGKSVDFLKVYKNIYKYTFTKL